MNALKNFHSLQSVLMSSLYRFDNVLLQDRALLTNLLMKAMYLFTNPFYTHSLLSKFNKFASENIPLYVSLVSSFIKFKSPSNTTNYNCEGYNLKREIATWRDSEKVGFIFGCESLLVILHKNAISNQVDVLLNNLTVSPDDQKRFMNQLTDLFQVPTLNVIIPPVSNLHVKIMIHLLFALNHRLFVDVNSFLNNLRNTMTLNLLMFKLFMFIVVCYKISVRRFEEDDDVPNNALQQLVYISDLLQQMGVLPRLNASNQLVRHVNGPEGKLTRQVMNQELQGGSTYVPFDIVSYNCNSNFIETLSLMFCTLTSLQKKSITPLHFPDIICLQEVNNNVLDTPIESVPLSYLANVNATVTSLKFNTDKNAFNLTLNSASSRPKRKAGMDSITGEIVYTGFLAQQSAGCKDVACTFKNLYILIRNHSNLNIKNSKYFTMKRYIDPFRKMILRKCYFEEHSLPRELNAIVLADSTFSKNREFKTKMKQDKVIDDYLSGENISCLQYDKHVAVTTFLFQEIEEYIKNEFKQKIKEITNLGLVDDYLDEADKQLLNFYESNENITRKIRSIDADNFFPQKISTDEITVNETTPIRAKSLTCDADDQIVSTNLQIRENLIIRGILCVTLELEKKKRLTIATIHNTNNSNNIITFTSYLKKLKEIQKPQVPFILIGDTNISLEEQKDEELSDILEDTQIGVGVSREVTSKNNKLIDWAVYSKPNVVWVGMEALTVGKNTELLNCTAGTQAIQIPRVNISPDLYTKLTKVKGMQNLVNLAKTQVPRMNLLLPTLITPPPPETLIDTAEFVRDHSVLKGSFLFLLTPLGKKMEINDFEEVSPSKENESSQPPKKKAKK